MSEVSVIGLGVMGSALARVLLRAGYHVTVWNRTSVNAEPLVRDGAVLAPSAASAVGASPIVIVCVSNYQASHNILQTREVTAALAGRVLVQLSTGTPKEARDTAVWAGQQGVDYLDGAILAWPSQIGGPETTILVSGPETTFRRSEPLLRILAGNLTYMGGPVASSSVLFAAVLSCMAGQLMGLCHGALVCEAEGLRVDTFGSVLANIAPILGAESKHLGEVIQTGNFGKPESTLKTAGEDIGRLVQQAEEAGINAEIPRFAAALFRRAIDAGYGAEEHAALIKILRTDGSPVRHGND